MTGGTNVFSSLNIRDWGKFSSCLAVLNMDGPTANFRVSGNVQMGYENRDTGVTSTYGYLNLNAGTFQCNRLTRGVTDATHGILDREQSKMFVNFNGGTLKTAANVGYTGDSLGGLFGDCQDMVNSNWVDRVFVYEKGATIETDAEKREVQIRNVLRAPYGKGVKSIAVGTIFADRKLLMPPTIKVWGVNDKGEGATARAEIDFETGAVTNIVVTSPGCGYEDGAVAYAYYGSLYNNQGEKCGEVVVADNVSGGLTKQGPGTLFLTATNTYTGATVVKEGSLKLGVDDAIDAASALVLKGGTFDLANRPQTFSDITFAGGQIVNGRPTITGLTVDFAAVCAGEPKAVDATQCTFAANAKLSLVNFDPSGLEEGRRYLLATFTDAVTLDISEAQALIPEGWVLRLGPRSLRLVPVSGMILIVR